MIPDGSLPPMQSREIQLRTGSGTSIVDLTEACVGFLADAAGGADGLLHVFVPHATAGLALMELGAGSDEDLGRTLEQLLPRDAPWAHAHGMPGHGADHVLPALVSPSIVIPVVGGRMTLGTWQSVTLVDPNRDNRDRRVRLSFVPA